jgi:hypothetical protein
MNTECVGYIVAAERIEGLDKERKKKYKEMRRINVSYIFCTCTIHFTSLYRLACPSTAENHIS